MRRLRLAWEMLEKLKPSHLVTHRFPISQVAQAYRLLDQKPGQVIQVVLTYY